MVAEVVQLLVDFGLVVEEADLRGLPLQQEQEVLVVVVVVAGFHQHLPIKVKMVLQILGVVQEISFQAGLAMVVRVLFSSHTQHKIYI
jgi:hypothetical protein